MTKSIKIILGVVVFLIIGIGSNYFINTRDYNEIELDNGKVLNVRNYSYTKDLNIKEFLNSFGDNEKTASSILINKALESDNITYPEEIQKRVLNQNRINDFDYSEDFIIVKIPYDNKLDMKKIAKNIGQNNIYFVEEIYDDMMYNFLNIYFNFGGTGNESKISIYEVKNNEVIEENEKVTTDIVLDYLK